jgi:hypothetical protein
VVGDAGIVSRNLPEIFAPSGGTEIESGAADALDGGLALAPDGDVGEELAAAAAAISSTALRSLASTPEKSHESNDALGSSGWSDAGAAVVAVDVRLDSDSTDDRGRVPLLRPAEEPNSRVREVMGRTMCDNDDRTELMVSARERDVLGVDEAENPSATES